MTNWNLVHASDTAEELQQILDIHGDVEMKVISSFVEEINHYLTKAIIEENQS